MMSSERPTFLDGRPTPTRLRPHRPIDRPTGTNRFGPRLPLPTTRDALLAASRSQTTSRPTFCNQGPASETDQPFAGLGDLNRTSSTTTSGRAALEGPISVALSALRSEIDSVARVQRHWRIVSAKIGPICTSGNAPGEFRRHSRPETDFRRPITVDRMTSVNALFDPRRVISEDLGRFEHLLGVRFGRNNKKEPRSCCFDGFGTKFTVFDG